MKYAIKLLDNLFSEPYGLDDSFELLRMQHDKNPKERHFNERAKIYNFYTKEGKHYKLHSDTALIFTDSMHSEAREYLESKIISFMKSYEWETWAYKHAESEGARF